MPSRRLQLLLFALSFITFAWFHQGGGWNQNARFAEVRALTEQGRLAIDDYLVYQPAEGRKLTREHVVNAEFVRDGKVHRLCWGNGPWDYSLASVNGRPTDDGTALSIIGWDSCTGDIGYSPDGHFHPNKPPGSSLLAAIPYFALYHAERRIGADPDDWWVMNVNAWLCSALTVGLASALGVVLVLRLAAQLFPGHPAAALGAAVTLGFGTTFFPFATLMFDHNVTAVLLLASLAAVRSGKPLQAGIWSGLAAVTNYLAAIPGMMFGLWALCRRTRGAQGVPENAPGPRELRWRDAMRFIVGVLPCLAALLVYNVAAFGSPFTLNTSFQNPVFKETAPAFLGMFTWPSWFATLAITISPWRGIFILSPVLILAAVLLARRRTMETLTAERRLILACIAFFFLINVSFNGFHGGFAAGPRYLIPALPLLCLPLAPAFVRWPRTATILAAVSIAQQTVLTVTDALSPLGVGSHAWVNRPGEWKDKLFGNSLVFRYAWPIFAHGRAWPVIDAKFDEWFASERRRLEKEIPDVWEREKKLAVIRAQVWEQVRRGDEQPLWIAAIQGPVSANVLGPWDGTFFQKFHAHTGPAQWAAFNAGEFFWPASRWSIAPLLALWIAGAIGLRRWLKDGGVQTMR